MKRCMIYACSHAWSWIEDPSGLYVGHECLRCGDVWDTDFCNHDPRVTGCECAR